MTDAITQPDQEVLRHLKDYLSRQADLEFAVLVGSRATGTGRPDSDWDIAVQWERDNLDYEDHLARLETLRYNISQWLSIPTDQIDLIDTPSAKLAMRELIANEGLVLTDPESLPWLHFLQRTWREIEDYYWSELYVA